MASLDNNPTLRLRLLRELAQRLCWSGLAYALFATLLSLNLDRGARGVGLLLAALLAVSGTARTVLARRVMAARDPVHHGDLLIWVTRIQSCTFGVFVAYAMWHVQGQVIPECVVIVGVAGFSSVSAGMFAPFPWLSRLNVSAQLLPVYVWSVYAQPRYGWLLLTLMAIHAVTILETIRINGAHSRQMFVAQITLELQSQDLM